MAVTAAAAAAAGALAAWQLLRRRAAARRPPVFLERSPPPTLEAIEAAARAVLPAYITQYYAFGTSWHLRGWLWSADNRTWLQWPGAGARCAS